MLSGPWLFDATTHCSYQDEVGNTLRPFWTYQTQGGKDLGIFIGEEKINDIEEQAM